MLGGAPGEVDALLGDDIVWPWAAAGHAAADGAVGRSTCGGERNGRRAGDRRARNGLGEGEGEGEGDD